jgi:Neuraminidase (sialidase)
LYDVYHGGSDVIKSIDLSRGRTDVDFGQGFYVTTLWEQAQRWAQRRSLRAKGKKAVVNHYVYEKGSELDVLAFDGYCEEWLDFVVANRTSEDKPVVVTYDIIMGRVADDDVINAIDRYIAQLEAGRVTRNTKLALLDELKFAKPNDQICFKTDLALRQLRFIGAEVIDNG